MSEPLQPNPDNGPLPDAPSGPVEDSTPDVRRPLVDDPAFYRDCLLIASWWLSQDKPDQASDVIHFALRGDRPPIPQRAEHLPLFEDQAND